MVAEKVRGKPLPNGLLPAMIPPSLRQAYAASLAATPTSGVGVASSAPTGVSGLVTASLGAGLTASMATSTTTTSSAWGAPIASLKDDSGDDGGLGFGSDFSAIKELDNITNEIDSIRK